MQFKNRFKNNNYVLATQVWLFCLLSFVTLRLQTEHPFKSKKMVWHKLLSKQRR